MFDKFGQQCCGKSIVSDSLTCCGDGDMGKSHMTTTGKTCCGSNYISMDTSVCCTDSEGKNKVSWYFENSCFLTFTLPFISSVRRADFGCRIIFHKNSDYKMTDKACLTFILICVIKSYII